MAAERGDRRRWSSADVWAGTNRANGGGVRQTAECVGSPGGAVAEDGEDAEGEQDVGCGRPPVTWRPHILWRGIRNLELVKKGGRVGRMEMRSKMCHPRCRCTQRYKFTKTKISANPSKTQFWSSIGFCALINCTEGVSTVKDSSKFIQRSHCHNTSRC